ncbi:MAG: UDP-N-acetylmuramoyl-tripeptide--D-alanyl-D-alanine ligase [Hornefia sp.]|nr:UDP-N-acetylmuramoyl-tripeptide--D-alanyl-D-alanine ligase [Hornefia sp.]
MDAITAKELAEVTSGNLLKGSGNEIFTGICTDSRIFQEGDVFFALKGELADGHEFVPMVIDKGCKICVVSDEKAADDCENCTFIVVKDTLPALQTLTKWYLEKIAVKKIAITGSVGKTSTRDMVYYILKERYKTGRPIKNYNSDVGIPLTVAKFSSELEMAVLEEGMEFAGELHRLVDMTRPDVAIITNVGISHLENLGSRENLYKAKMEITDFFGEDNVLIINESNDMLDKNNISGNYKVISIGEKGSEDYVVSDIRDRGIDGVDFTLTHKDKRKNFTLNVPGAHNAINAALAVAGCDLYGVTWEEAQRGLLKMELTGKRLKIRENKGIRVLDDSYNAAPDSVKSAIKTMETTDCSRRIAILGAMNELGDDTPKHHYEVGRFAAEHKVDVVIGIEPKAKDIVQGAVDCGIEGIYFDEKEDLYPQLKKILKEGDLILTKASMTRHFWEIADEIMNLEL